MFQYTGESTGLSEKNVNWLESTRSIDKRWPNWLKGCFNLCVFGLRSPQSHWGKYAKKVNLNKPIRRDSTAAGTRVWPEYTQYVSVFRDFDCPRRSRPRGMSMHLLGVCDPQDFSAESTNERYGLVHRSKLWYWNMGGLVHTLPVLNLERTQKYLEHLWQVTRGGR